MQMLSFVISYSRRKANAKGSCHKTRQAARLLIETYLFTYQVYATCVCMLNPFAPFGHACYLASRNQKLSFCLNNLLAHLFGTCLVAFCSSLPLT